MDWIDHYADEHTCPQARHVTQRSAGRTGFSYTAVSMIRFIMVSRLVTDNAMIRKMLEHTIRIIVPDVLLEYCTMSLEHVPAKSTISKYLLALDASYSQMWQGRWTEILNADMPPSIFLMSDSSPQFGTDWFLQRMVIVTDIQKAAQTQAELVSLLPTNVETDKDQGGWIASSISRRPSCQHCQKFCV